MLTNRLPVADRGRARAAEDASRNAGLYMLINRGNDKDQKRVFNEQMVDGDAAHLQTPGRFLN